jgi:phospholipid/cholesterol/gamma-HCH transport system substrate-binding protein
MKSSHQIEFTAGLFLLLGVAALVFLAIHATDGGTLEDGGYRLVAEFGNVGGLKPRANVSLGGVRIGSVESISLDPESFSARVVMIISDRYRNLPDDTSASILTSGILGDQYIGLEPGGSPEYLSDGDQIMITQSAIVLEQLISRFLFNSGAEEQKP